MKFERTNSLMIISKLKTFFITIGNELNFFSYKEKNFLSGTTTGEGKKIFYIVKIL